MSDLPARIEGYAVVCDRGCIADATGAMPEALKNDAEWDFFQAALDAADVSVLGRRSYDVTPNPRGRRRLIMTRSVDAPVRKDELIVFWNPAAATLTDALALYEMPVRTLAVTGGRDVFDYFLAGPTPFTNFYLSRMHGVSLPGGVGVFSAVETEGHSPEYVLTAKGYVAGDHQHLDTQVDVVDWVRKGGK